MAKDNENAWKNIMEPGRNAESRNPQAFVLWPPRQKRGTIF
jgi:hypothetical protein